MQSWQQSKFGKNSTSSNRDHDKNQSCKRPSRSKGSEKYRDEKIKDRYNSCNLESGPSPFYIEKSSDISSKNKYKDSGYSRNSSKDRYCISPETEPA